MRVRFQLVRAVGLSTPAAAHRHSPAEKSKDRSHNNLKIAQHNNLARKPNNPAESLELPKAQNANGAVAIAAKEMPRTHRERF
jgi:hypothetical protein